MPMDPSDGHRRGYQKGLRTLLQRINAVKPNRVTPAGAVGSVFPLVSQALSTQTTALELLDVDKSGPAR